MSFLYLFANKVLAQRVATAER